MTPIQIVGFDPSLTATGGVRLHKEGFGNLTVQDFGCIQTKAADGPSRLCVIREFAVAMLTGEPGVCGVECNYLHKGRSPQTALECREAVAVCIEAAASLGWAVVRVAPTQAKAALGVAGGGSTKAQMVQPASLIFPGTFLALRFKYNREAVADAIGVALVADRQATP